MNRKSIRKSIRFEVLKRDCFKCQYCGANAPDVILEVDHITPVSKGGDNSITNLITACKDCNLGKSDRELSDTARVKKEYKQMEDIQNKKEQIEMMAQWKLSLKEIDNLFLHNLQKYISELTIYEVPISLLRLKLMKHRKKYSDLEIYNAIEAGLGTYYKNDDPNGVHMMLDKIGGILHVRRMKAEDPFYDIATKMANKLKYYVDGYGAWTRAYNVVRFLISNIEIHGEIDTQKNIDLIHRHIESIAKGDVDFEYLEFIKFLIERGGE